MSEMLPKSWILTKLVNVSTHPQYGWTCSSKSSGTLKLLRTTDISDGKINWETVPYCSIEPEENEKYLLKNNDILVSRAGSIGISYRISKSDLLHRTVFASYLIRFCPFIPPTFVEHYFKSHHYWQYISDSQLGIAVPNVNATKLSELPFPLPPLNEQKRIIAKLDQLIPRIEQIKERLDKIPAIIKRFCKSVLTAAVTGKLTEKWREKNPELKNAMALLSKRNFSINKEFKELYDIPENWLWCALGNYADLSRGRFSIRPRNDPRYYNGSYPFIQIGDLPKQGGFITEHNQTLNELGFRVSKQFKENTIAIAIVGATIGNTGLLSYEMCFPDSLIGIITPTKFSSLYVDYYLRTEKENIRNISYSSGGQPNIKLPT